MSYELEADYYQDYMFPPRLEELLGADHPARFIREFVDALDLEELSISQRVSDTQGRPSYSPRLLLRVWLYGYFTRVRSTRGLERSCQENLPFMWLSGMHRPDHSTLHRFFQSNRKSLRKLFKQTVKVACKMKLVEFVLQAVDGTKIESAASWRGGYDKDGLLKLLGRADKQIKQLEAQISESNEDALAKLPQELSTSKQLRAKLQEALDEVESTQSKHKHPEELDAERMQCNGRNRFGHNAQVVVDSAQQIIVAESVCQERTDFEQLEPMLEQAEQVSAHRAEHYLADAGYSSADNFKKMETKGLNLLSAIPASTQKSMNHPYGITQFQYNEQANTMRCPQGQILPFTRKRLKEGRIELVFQNPSACTQCPARSQCTKSRYRMLSVPQNHQSLRAHCVKMSCEDNRRVLKQRSGIVEPIFAQIKQNMGFRRWTLKGKDNVQAQWSLLCATYNLKKLYQQWKKDHFSLNWQIFAPFFAYLASNRASMPQIFIIIKI